MGNKNELEVAVKSFEDIKHVDETGKEYWNAHELCKALGYSQYQKFTSAIKRAQDQMINNGIDPDEHLTRSDEMLEITNQYGAVSKREVEGYKLDRRAAYTVSMNADPTKPQVAIGQEYFLQNTAKVEVIEKRMKDANLIDKRNGLKIANKILNNKILARDVEPDEIGIVTDAGDQGFFNMKTKEVKEMNNIPTNRPIADFMPVDVMIYKSFAQINSEREIEKQDLHGIKDISEAVHDENAKAREMYIEKFDIAPENKMPGDDVKKIEQKYNKQTQKYLDALNYEV